MCPLLPLPLWTVLICRALTVTLPVPVGRHPGGRTARPDQTELDKGSPSWLHSEYSPGGFLLPRASPTVMPRPQTPTPSAVPVLPPLLNRQARGPEGQTAADTWPSPALWTLQPCGTATKPPVSAAHWRVVSRSQGTSCHQDLGARPAARGASVPSDTPGRHQGWSAGPRPFMHPLTTGLLSVLAGMCTHTLVLVFHAHTRPIPPGTLRASGKESEDFPGPLHVVSGTPPSLSPPCPPPPLPSPSPALEKGGCPLRQSVLRPPTQFTSQREQDTPLCLQPPCCPGLATGEASSGIKVAPCAWTQTLASGWSPGFKPWPHPPIASRVNPKQNSNTCEPPFGCVSTSQRHA